MTSLSEKLALLIGQEPDRKRALEGFARELETETGTRADFCRLHGRRWAHYAGYPGAVVPEERVEIAPGWGVVLERNILSEEEWLRIGERLTEP